jgi:hypothetical protein
LRLTLPALGATLIGGNWAGVSPGLASARPSSRAALFDLKGEPDEYCEFDSEALLRSSPKNRIDMWARATQGGIYFPNEARKCRGLGQCAVWRRTSCPAQVVPLSAAAAISTNGATIPPSPAAPAPPSAEAVPPRLTKAQHLGDRNAIRRRVAGGR